MAALLSKFRIDYSDLTLIPDVTKRADDTTRNFFDGIIKDFKGDPEDSGTIYCIIYKLLGQLNQYAWNK